MGNEFVTSERPVLIAVNPHEFSHEFVANGIKLAERLGLPARIVGICEPDVGTNAYLAHSFVTPYPEELLRALDTRRLEETKHVMNEILAKHEGQTSAKVQVNSFISEAVHGVLSDAKLHDAAMILCEARHDSYKFFPSGFSTSYGLIEKSHVPVMILHKDSRVDFTESDLRFLVCDDFLDHSEEAITTACRFTGCFEGAKLTHLHVVASQGDLNTFFDYVSSLVQYDLGVRSETDFQEQLLKHASQSMVLRSEAGRKSLSMDAYHADLVHGDPHEKIEGYLQENPADLLIFGHHSAFHKESYSFGKMSYRAMLSMKKPVMVVPPNVGQKP